MFANTCYLELMSILTGCFLAVEIDELNHEGRELIFEKKRQVVFEKKTWL